MTSKIKDLPFIPASGQVAIVKKTKASGTAGTTRSTKAVTYTVELDVVEGDTSLISVSSNQMTVQPGTYVLIAMSEQGGNSGYMDIWDVDNLVKLFQAQNNFPAATTPEPILMKGIITLSEETVLEYRIHDSGNNGQACSYGVDEVYSILIFIKI